MSDPDLHPVMQAALAPHMPPKVHPAKAVEALYILADLLIDTDRTINGTYGLTGVWRSLTPERQAQFDAVIGDYDFLMTSRKIRAYADAWQAELDAEPTP